MNEGVKAQDLGNQDSRDDSQIKILGSFTGVVGKPPPWVPPRQPGVQSFPSLEVLVFSIKNYMVQNGEKQDDCLHRELFPVNMRLYKENTYYHTHILSIIDNMRVILNASFDDYEYVSGISGANLGIPYNIIGYHENGKKNGKPVFMLNPKIVGSSSGDTKVTKSNCGSLNLDEKVRVERFMEVSVAFYDLEGNTKLESFELREGGGTIQHEIDHNNGILIIDKTED